MAGEGAIAMLSRATRAKTLPVMLSPVAVGAGLAVDRGAPFSPGWFALTLIGAALMHLGANVINDYFDYASGADNLARMDRTAIVTGSGLIASGAMTQREVLRLAAALFTGALVCGAVLAAARGVEVLVLGAAGAFLAFAYVAPPVKYGYRGRGLGEVGIFAAFGLLPVAGSYFVQAQRLDAVAWWGAIVPGMLTTLVLFHHHFLHWRADKASGKLTPVALLEPPRALLVSLGAIIATYIVLVVQVALDVFAAWALAALVTAVPLLGNWARARLDPMPQNILNLLGATLGASVLTGAIITLTLFLA